MENSRKSLLDIEDAYYSGSISGKEASGNLISLRRMVREQSVAEAKSGGFAPNVPELYYKLERLSDQIIDEMIQEKKGMLRVWNLSLLCATFSLTILGTFITRSGVLESVHSFTESEIGPPLLGFFLLVVITSVGLIAWRGESLRSPGSISSPLSRTGAFLLNNLLFGCFAFVVFLGTVFPLIVEALNGDRISVGNPYFVKMSTPIGFALLFMMAVAPALSWGKTGLDVLLKRLTPLSLIHI